MAISARRTVDIAKLAQPSLLRLSEKSPTPRCCRAQRASRRFTLRVRRQPSPAAELSAIRHAAAARVGAGNLALLVWLPDAEIEATSR